ncbi:Macrophage mannose receptor 1 [Merluccius polli]|uniref:Macrophage mannose receptor 1 n=1 Tax=Merluccius polli TaxID=89951 RepID=A0AA47NUC1_MERPO|nr:Macrophage mannose receptor 1 [Merluccius polli]
MASRDYCLQRDADLIVINSREEQEFVTRLGGHYWIGLSERDPEGTWKWVDGTNMTSSSWGPDQPDDNGGAADCVATWRDSWFDEQCDRLNYWICEKVVVLDHLEAELNKEVMREGEAPVFIDSPSSKTVSVGKTAHFSCRARGKPEPTIEWLHNDRPLKRDRTDNQSESAVWMDGGGDLIVRGVRSGVETVRCVANNSAGTASSDPAELIVYDRRPDGWMYFNHSLYFISTTGRNWTASRDDCLERDADLVVINSTAEQEFVTRLGGIFWIGLSDRDPEGTWKWVDGTNMTSSSWGEGQPDDEYGAEDCVEVRGDGWNDAQCDHLNYCICEVAVLLGGHYWIGLSERDPEWTWKWVDGTNMTSSSISSQRVTEWYHLNTVLHFLFFLLFSSWGDDQPDDYDGAEDCVEPCSYVTLSFGLLCILQATLNISLRLLVCSKITSSVIITVFLLYSTDDLRRLGWLYFNHRLYFISTTMRNWMASRDDCLQRDADLIVINSREEQEFVNVLRGDYWIGLSDRDPEGTWKWVDGTNMTSSSWGPGQPDDYGGAADCVAAWGNGWYDEQCDRLKSWICEKVVVLDHLEAELNKEVMREGEAPVFIYSPSTKKVSVGNTTRFYCRARGNPKPTIEWLHNDRPLKRDRTDNQSEPAVWVDGGDLVIRGVRSGVETVRCVANNRAGTARSHTGKLYVYDRRPDGWLYFNHRLYFSSTTKRNWTASRDYCLQRDADLIVINSREEQEFVSVLGDHWIGLSDRDTEGTWKWVDGTNMTSSSWGESQPDDYDGAEDCVAARGNGWYDARCDKLKYWMCEKVVVL